MNEKDIVLCAISNISSGACSEDCGFCTQSAKYHTGIEQFLHKPLEKILYEAHQAKDVGALGFCLVSAGCHLDDEKLDFVLRIAHTVLKEIPDFHLIACNGIASLEALKELKKGGIQSYNHNLETARSFYPHVVSTMSWDERFTTCQHAKEAGLSLCTGGIFGLGETDEQRREFIQAIQELSPMSMPINFYIPHQALPLRPVSLTPQEALYWIKYAHEQLPQTMIMLAGGREYLLGKEWTKALEYGAKAIIIGDYLTVSGENPHNDLVALHEAGYYVAKTCM